MTVSNIKNGYKQTEIGVIPEDWQNKKLEEICHLSKIRLNPVTSSNNFKCVELEHLSQGTGRLLGYIDSSEQLSQKTFFKKGDVLFGKLRPYLKKFLFPTFDGVCSSEIWVLNSINNIESKWLYYLIQTDKVLEAANQSTGTKMPRAEWNIVGNVSIPIPPTKAEQSAIAIALSDTDSLITGLEQLIAKKRAIKQGAMEELLTGKRRLPGFSGEWEELNMEENSILKARIGWQGLTTVEYLTIGDYYLITGTDFCNGKINWTSCCYVNENRYKQDKNIQLQINDILLTKDGTIGKVGYVNFLPGPATLNSGVFVIRPKNNSYYPRFFYYILMSGIFDDFLVKLKAGSTISHLYQKDFVNFTFMVPKIEEQTAIAEILSDMDTEIESLELKLEKYKKIKQGMMQELLTGRTRLI